MHEARVGRHPDRLVVLVEACGKDARQAARPADQSRQLVPVPAGVDPAEAVCLPANYLTAYLAMHETAKVVRGERILVHGAAGGVGSALVQLGKLAGLEMYGTASQYNHDIVSALGATPIDYRTEDFVKRIRALTTDGVDVVFDPIGGARQVLRSYRALRPGGRLMWFGMAATKDSGLRVIPFTLVTLMLLKLVPGGKQVPLTPDLGEYAKTHSDWYRDTLTELLDLLAEGRIKRLTDKGFGFIEMLIVLLVIGGLAYYIFLRPTEEGVREAQKIVDNTEDRVQENLNLGALRTQIKVYRMENGKYPDSLEDIAQEKTFQTTGLDISRYNYDPATGTVEIRISTSTPPLSVLIRPSWGRRFSEMSSLDSVLMRLMMALWTFLGSL